LLEKKRKLKAILSYALQVINGLTSNIKEIREPTRSGYNQIESSKVKNYFSFAGSESGLEFSAPQFEKDQPTCPIGKTTWPFQKGYTAVIKFKCHKSKVFSAETQSAQSFDPLNLPVLLNCFSEGYGGFECYINPSFQVIYRVLSKNYSPPTVESNGVKIADVVLDQWNVIFIEHDKPYLARAQLISIMNDKQQMNLPMDYPKFDQKAMVTNISVCKGMNSQLAYFALFKDHFSHLKKFAAQLLKLDSFDEVILKNEISLDQYFSDQTTSNQAVNFDQKICLLYSPLRATQCQAFQCIQSKDNQFNHQVSNDLSPVLLFNSGLRVAHAQTDLDISQLLPLLEMLLDWQGDVKDLVNQWLKIISVQKIRDSQFI
jgi:hypothetical protein